MTVSRRTRSAARSSAARCRGSRICGSCAAPVATPTTSRSRSRHAAVFVRAPHAHASIVSIDTSAARAHPGVLAVLTGDDYVADGHLGMAHFPNPADAIDVSIPSFAPMPERKILDELQLPLAVGRVRYVGEAVAMVVAESLVGRPRRRREGRGRLRDPARGHRRRGGAVARGADDLAGRTRQSRARQRVRRSRRRRSRDRGRPRRHRADHPQPAHRQRVHGAALGDRPLRRSRGPVHPDLGMPGRPSRAASAGGLSQGAAGARARDLSRRRRRLRLAHQSLSGAGRGGVGGAPRGACR